MHLNRFSFLIYFCSYFLANNLFIFLIKWKILLIKNCINISNLLFYFNHNSICQNIHIRFFFHFTWIYFSSNYFGKVSVCNVYTYRYTEILCTIKFTLDRIYTEWLMYIIIEFVRQVWHIFYVKQVYIYYTSFSNIKTL